MSTYSSRDFKCFCLLCSWHPLTLLTAARRLQLTTKVRLSVVYLLFNDAQVGVLGDTGLVILLFAEEKVANLSFSEVRWLSAHLLTAFLIKSRAKTSAKVDCRKRKEVFQELNREKDNAIFAQVKAVDGSNCGQSLWRCKLAGGIRNTIKSYDKVAKWRKSL